MMPALFALGQNAALQAVNARLRDGERLFAFLDDVYVICIPERVGDIHGALREELWAHARIRVHNGKTRVWNREGVKPPVRYQRLKSSSDSQIFTIDRRTPPLPPEAFPTI